MAFQPLHQPCNGHTLWHRTSAAHFHHNNTLRTHRTAEHADRNPQAFCCLPLRPSRLASVVTQDRKPRCLQLGFKLP